MKTKYLLLLTAMLLNMHVYSQQDTIRALKIGEKVPDVNITSMLNGKRSTAKISDFKGKLIIIDFWATYCAPCIAAMPKLDTLQQKFKDQIRIFAVTSEQAEIAFKTLNTYPSLKGLNLPIISNDKTLRKLFPYNGVPYEIIIDQNGIVKATTDAAEITEGHIATILKGNMPAMHKKITVPFDYEKPFFMNTDGENVLSHHLMTGYFDGLGSRQMRRGETKEHGDTRLAAINMDIPGLFTMALYKRLSGGEMVANRYVINVKEPNRLVPPKGLNNSDFYEWLSKNGYCVDFIVPPTEASSLYGNFRKELEDFFRIEAKVEKRNVKCWILKSRDSTLFASRSQTSLKNRDKFLWTFQRNYIGEVVADINYRLDQPLLDETGYKKPVDINLKPNFKNISSFKMQLNNIGLDLMEEYRNIEMIVFTDK